MTTGPHTGPAPDTVDGERQVAEILARLPAGTIEAGLLSLQHGLDIIDQAAPTAPGTAGTLDACQQPVATIGARENAPNGDKNAGTPQQPPSDDAHSACGIDPNRDIFAGTSPSTSADRAGVAAVVDHLVAPVRLVDDWPDPSDPLPATGGGAVHADLIDEDRDALARLRSAHPLLGAEALAAEAQQWRLPVTPYRQLPADPEHLDGQHTDREADPKFAVAHASDRSIEGRVVVDLSALWAGPLATSLLADVGVRVIKLDPRCRPDAFGEHPALYARLNGGKEIIDLDLRDDGDRQQFESLLAGADLVVDSFSRRVMPNLGYGPDRLRALKPTVATLSIVAFPAGSAEQDWVAYGPGVHATSGLGVANPYAPGGIPGRRFQHAPIAYPDVLAGLAAFAEAAELLTTAGPSAHCEVSLAAAVRPLVERAVTQAVGRWG